MKTGMTYGHLLDIGVDDVDPAFVVLLGAVPSDPAEPGEL